MAAATIIAVVLAVIIIFSSEEFSVFRDILSILASLWWIILPIPVYKLFRLVWTEYTELSWVIKQESVLLEIRPPADVEKSPKIMEQIFAGLHTWSTPNKFETYCGWRPLQDKFSFEVASSEGTVHFYIRCPKMARNNVEAQIYAQYPDAEIFEAEDYTKKVPKNLPNRDWDVWGTALKLVRDDEYPIRTYKKFIEDVTGKMIDPLASMTEVMSLLGKDQHTWVQYVFTPENDPNWRPKSEKLLAELAGKAGKTVSAGDKAATFIGNIFRGFFGGEFKNLEPPAPEEFNINKLTPAEQEIYKAIYENISKSGFATVIRFCYVGKREGFNKAHGVAGIMGAFKQFVDVNLNALIPNNDTKTFANYYFTEPRLRYRQRKIVQDYRDRAFQVKPWIFNTEELATVFHFPDMSVKTPAVQRIEAKKGEAPFNLPIEQ